MFHLEKIDFFGEQKLKLVDDQTGAFLSVIPGFGGNLNELGLFKGGKVHEVIQGDKTLESLSGKTTNFYRGAKLSPYPNRVAQGKYNFEGKEYQLPINAPPHALHGLCWNLPLTIKAQLLSTELAQLILQADYNSFDVGYPFNYHIEIEYRLESAQLTCITRVTNTGNQAIPIGDGWHPYFTLGSNIDKLKLQLPASRQLELDNSLIPTGKYVDNNLFVEPLLLKGINLDHCFEAQQKEGIIETKLMDDTNNISIIVWQQAAKHGYNYIQAYTPPDRNSIAIEPMSCAPNAFNNQMGLLILQPNELAEFSFGVRVENYLGLLSKAFLK